MDNEAVVFSNSLGTLTNKRIIFNFKDGAEDIPLKQVTSIGYEQKQNIFLAIVYFGICGFILFSIASMHQVQGAVIVIAIILIIFFALIGVANYIGNCFIRLSVAGQDRPLMKVEMAKTREGRELTEAIRKQLIN